VREDYTIRVASYFESLLQKVLINTTNSLVLENLTYYSLTATQSVIQHCKQHKVLVT